MQSIDNGSDDGVLDLSLLLDFLCVPVTAISMVVDIEGKSMRK